MRGDWAWNLFCCGTVRGDDQAVMGVSLGAMALLVCPPGHKDIRSWLQVRELRGEDLKSRLMSPKIALTPHTPFPPVNCPQTHPWSWYLMVLWPPQPGGFSQASSDVRWILGENAGELGLLVWALCAFSGPWGWDLTPTRVFWRCTPTRDGANLLLVAAHVASQLLDAGAPKEKAKDAVM